MKPGWINTGYEVDGVRQFKGWTMDQIGLVPSVSLCGWVVSWKAIWDVRMDDVAPLTFVHPDGRMFRCDLHFVSDGMSNPKWTQIFWERMRFLGPIFHDSGYRFSGLWISTDDGKTFVFTPMTRADVDDLLRVMVAYDPVPGTLASQWAIWAGVRMGGWMFWGDGDYRDK